VLPRERQPWVSPSCGRSELATTRALGARALDDIGVRRLHVSFAAVTR
jgi:hypothetical protein